MSGPIDLGPIRRAIAGGEDINPTTAGAMVREIEALRVALAEAVNEWEYAAHYKTLIPMERAEEKAKIATARTLIPLPTIG